MLGMACKVRPCTSFSQLALIAQVHKLGRVAAGLFQGIVAVSANGVVDADEVFLHCILYESMNGSCQALAAKFAVVWL